MKNDPSLSPLFDEFVKTLPPYDDPRDAEISALRQQLAECERERVFQANAHKMAQDALLEQGQQLATVTAERNELVAEAKKFCDDWKFCRGSVRAFQELQIALAKLGADKGEK